MFLALQFQGEHKESLYWGTYRPHVYLGIRARWFDFHPTRWYYSFLVSGGGFLRGLTFETCRWAQTEGWPSLVCCLSLPLCICFKSERLVKAVCLAVLGFFVCKSMRIGWCRNKKIFPSVCCHLRDAYPCAWKYDFVSFNWFPLFCRAPQSLIAGLMWLGLKSGQYQFRHVCQDSDDFQTYGWTHHNGRDYGRQLVIDEQLSLTTHFFKTKMDGSAYGGDWAIRVDIKPNGM